MSTQQNDKSSTKGTTKGYSEEHHKQAKIASKARKNHGRRGQIARNDGYLSGLSKDRREAAREEYIRTLDTTVFNARLIADELMFGLDREVAEYMITKYFALSQQSKSNKPVKFIDVRDAIRKDLAGDNIKQYIVSRATNKTLGVLRGGHQIAMYGEDFDATLTSIKQHEEEYLKNREHKQTATPVRELVLA
jgi:hypothetical protein